MMNTVSILGMGLSIPDAIPTRDAVKRAGGDPTGYEGWPYVCLADEADHPSTMGALALTRAMDDAGISSSDVRLVLAVGTSRDYLPSWSLATELIAVAGLSSHCIGWDMTLGCLGTLAGLETARGWLGLNGDGVAAIVAAERWSHTIRRDDPKSAALWAHGDGAGALIVGADGGAIRWRGAAFCTEPAYNAQILVKYGGTRFPIAPEGSAPYERTLSSRPRSEIWATYAKRYREVFDLVRGRFAVRAEHLVCNQVSPNLVTQIANIAGVAPTAVPRTGERHGHLGSVDVIAGLSDLRDSGLLTGDILVAGSTPYAFGAGLVTA